MPHLPATARARSPQADSMFAAAATPRLGGRAPPAVLGAVRARTEPHARIRGAFPLILAGAPWRPVPICMEPR